MSVQTDIHLPPNREQLQTRFKCQNQTSATGCVYRKRTVKVNNILEIAFAAKKHV